MTWKGCKRIIFSTAISCGLTVSCIDSSAAQATYSEAQLKLAGQIGSVISLVDRCGKVPMPSAAIQRAMKAEGLKDSDLMRETAFKARVTKQAESLKAMEKLGAKTGQTDADLQQSACKNLVEMYGASGFVRAGLAAPR